MRVKNFVAAGLLLGSGAAVAIEPSAPIKVDAEWKGKLILLTDGKKHYVAVRPFDSVSDPMFYGDGKKFHSVPIVGSGSSGTTEFSFRFADPRFYSRSTSLAGIEFAEDKYTAFCGDRKVPLTRVDAKLARPMLDAAEYLASPRKWKSHALARDDRGNYYYVDRGRSQATEGQFRLFVGPKGKLVQQKMTNVVSDSQGDIFSTKTGDLRLIIDASKKDDREAKDGVWIKNEKSTKLTMVPIDENIAMIYNDLGIYAGERLGLPCDDL